MAIQTDILVESDRHAIIRAYSAVSGDVGTAVDCSSLTGYDSSNGKSRLSLVGLVWSISAGSINLQWVGDTNETIMMLSGNGNLTKTSGWPAFPYTAVAAVADAGNSSSSSSESADLTSTVSDIAVVDGGSLALWTLLLHVKKSTGFNHTNSGDAGYGV